MYTCISEWPPPGVLNHKKFLFQGCFSSEGEISISMCTTLAFECLRELLGTKLFCFVAVVVRSRVFLFLFLFLFLCRYILGFLYPIPVAQGVNSEVGFE